MSSASIIIFVTILVYLAAMLAMGYWCSKRNNDADDFYLGGRKLGPLVTAMSAEASDMSSYLLLGVPGLAYLSGLSEAVWTVIGLGVGTYLNWLLVSKRIRRYSIKLDAITIPEFFSLRYRDEKRILQFVAALVIIIFFVPYTASGFSACGKLFGTLFGMDYHITMIASAAVIIAYTMLGGFLAASTTDLVQSIIMTAAIVAVLVFGVNVAGGMTAVMDNAKSLPGFLSLVQSFVPETNTAKSFGFLSIVSTLAWGLGYFGMPHILLRFMAARKEEELTLSRRIATGWVFISMFVAVGIGVVGLGASKAGAIEHLTGADTETVLIKLSYLLSENGAFTAVIAGIILAGVLAATMSTADSQLLAAASSVSQDILTGVFKVNISDKKKILFARLTLALIGVFGIVFAWNPDSSIFRVVSFAWAGFGAAFGPVVLLALFWKKSNLKGAIAGMISGGAMVFIWKFGIAKLGGAFAIYELLPAFVISILINVIVSLSTSAPCAEIQKEFDEVKNNI